MLDSMRRYARSTGIKIVFGIIIATFILWGGWSFNDGASVVAAATVNGDAITPKELGIYSRQLESFYQRMYGEKYTPELAQSLDLRARALDQLINRSLLRQEAERLGLDATDEEVRDAIAAVDGFRVDGRFRRDIYFRFVRSQGMSPAEFEEQQRDDLLVKKIQNLYVTAISVDEKTAKALYSFANEKTNLSFVELEVVDYRKDVTVTPEEAREYYEKVKESFREPTRVEIALVAYPTEQFAEKAIVTDEEITTEYELRKDDRYTVEEEVHARHILFRADAEAGEEAKPAARERAEAALARIRAGEAFEAVAKEVSDDLANREEGGDLGFFPRGRMDEAFEKAAFALEPKTPSDVVESAFGYHLILVEEKRPERTKPLEEVREEIVERLRAEKSEGIARDAAFADAAAAKGGKSLEELAKERGLELQTPPPFAETETIVGAPRLPALVSTAFATAPGTVADPIEGPGTFFVLRVKEKIASHVPPFEKIQTRVEDSLIDGRAADAARAHGEKIRAALEGGKTLEEVAAAENLTVQETGAFSRGGEYVPKIGGVVGLARQAFELTPEKPVAPEIYVTGRAAYVVALEERVAADLEEFAKTKDEVIQRFTEEQQRIALDVLVRNLKRAAEIRVEPSALQPA
jgi:peptidyl-prolyl cis-trans isomerase D